MTVAEMLDAAVRAARQTIADTLDAAQASDDPESVVRLWLALEAIRDDAAKASTDAAQHGAAVLKGHDQYRLRVDDLPPVVRHTPKARKEWRKDELLAEVHRLIPLTDRLLSPSGEVEGDGEVALRLLQELVSLGGGKVTGLKRYGLDPAEFCTEETGVEKLRIET